MDDCCVKCKDALVLVGSQGEVASMTKVLVTNIRERDDSGGRGNDQAVAAMHVLSGRVNMVFAGGTNDAHPIFMRGEGRVARHRVCTAFDYTLLMD